MKTVSFVIVLTALCSINAFAASQDPCEAPALAAAKKWAKTQGVRGSDFQVAGVTGDNEGNSVYTIQLADPRSGGDCWTNIDVTVRESADDSCQALKAEENQSAESCS